MGGIVKKVVNAVEDIGHFVKKTVDVVVDVVNVVVDFVVNVVGGVINAFVGIVEGVITGDWTRFRDSFITIVSTVIYIIAIVVGVVTGNAALVAAGVIALDGLYNEGALTTYAVTAVGKAEREIFGSENILDNVDAITSAIVIAGTIYATWSAAPLLSDFTGLSALMSSQVVSVGMGIYSVNDAYIQFQEARTLYDELMNEYLSWLQEMDQKTKAYNKMWDAVYLEAGNDVLYEASAGGYLFNSGAGSSEYSVSSIHEQSSYLLGIDTNKDIYLDKTIHDSMDIDYINLNIDDIKPESLRYQF